MSKLKYNKIVENVQTGPRLADGPFSTRQADTVGVAIAMLVLAVGIALLIVWEEMRPSFERCSQSTDASARAACYEQVREQRLAQPSAKGANPGKPIRE